MSKRWAGIGAVAGLGAAYYLYKDNATTVGGLWTGLFQRRCPRILKIVSFLLAKMAHFSLHAQSLHARIEPLAQTIYGQGRIYTSCSIIIIKTSKLSRWCLATSHRQKYWYVWPNQLMKPYTLARGTKLYDLHSTLDVFVEHDCRWISDKENFCLWYLGLSANYLRKCRIQEYMQASMQVHQAKKWEVTSPHRI